MKLKTLLSALCVAMLSVGMAHADSFTYDVNVDSLDTGLVDSTDFALGDVASIDSVSIDIAQTWGGDLEIVLTAPDATTYELMFDDVSAGGSGNFDMGLVAADFSLANADTYVFVETGGAVDFADAFSAGGTYNANTWGAGGHAAGTWNLTINDDAAGDATSIGSVTVEYTPNAIPEPASAVVILAGFGIAAVRRRR